MALTHYDRNGHWIGNTTRFGDDDNNNNNSNNNAAAMARTETALDWFQRSSLKDSQRRRGNRKRHRRGSNDDNDNDCNESSSFLSALTDVNTATDPSMAARRFLRFGNSGIAPIDAAWKRSNDNNNKHHQHHQWHHRPLHVQLQLRQGQQRHLGPHQQQQTTSCSHAPPVVILEGPKDVGKTWMLLTLAARFVVSTRASRFKDVHLGSNINIDEDRPNGIEAATNERQEEDRNNSSTRTGSSNNHDGDGDNYNDNDSNNRNNQDRPKVLLLDSCFDFSVCQLVNVLRSTLRREREKLRVRERRHQEQRQQRPKDQQNIAATNKEIGGDQGCNGGRELEEKQHDGQCKNKQEKIEQELERQELERTSLERDMKDCLSRIHIIQVDGPNGWVPTLEALTHRLSEERDQYRTSGSGNDDIATQNVSKDVETSHCGPPTLLLWDGFLSDVAVTDSKNTMAMTTAIAMGGSGVDSHNNSHALFDNPVSREILRQVSRLLQEERNTLWWVLTARTTGGSSPAETANNPPHDNETALPFPTNTYGSRPTENSGIGFRVTEWIRKEEELREQKQQLQNQQLQQQQHQQHPGFGRQRQPQNRYPSPNRHPIPPRRASYRVRLDRLLNSSRSAGEERIPKNAAEAAALVAKVIGRGGTTNCDDDGNNNAGNSYHRQSSSVNSDQNIPYSISLGGILS